MTEEDPSKAVELPARLVFSLFSAAVRVAARVHMPLTRLQDLLRTAYFLEYRRRHPRDLDTVAKKLGVSIRTAGTLNRSLRGDFFAPETRVEPLRAVTGALVGRTRTAEQLIELTGLEEGEVRRSLRHLVQVGWVVEEEGQYALASTLRSFVAEDLERRIDAVNHQLTVIADSVWTRFVTGHDDDVAARTWAFVARPEDVREAVVRTLADLRSEAVGLEERALSQGGGAKYGITVAIAPLDEEEP